MLAVQAAPGRAIAPADLRAAVARAVPGLAIFDVQTVDDRLAAHLATERLLSALLVPLGAFGIFAVVTHLVVTERRELAVRMVLGATPAAILTLREGLLLTMIGIAGGAAGALLAGRSLSAVTFGIGPLDPLTLLAAGTATLLTTTLAVWWPARRASRLDPATVLRQG